MSVTSMTESERKYDVDESTRPPDLSTLGRVTATEPVTLRAVYFDTPDRALGERLFTLRCRTGGSDAGWHLKTPGGAGRTEYHAPLEADVAEPPGRHTAAVRGPRPPDEILALVRAVVRDRDVERIALLTTRRTRTYLSNDANEPVVELSDDVVIASDVRSGILRIWREWEVELLAAAPQGGEDRETLLDRVEEVVLAAGATSSPSRSKLARALGVRSLSGSGTERALAKDSSSLDVVRAILRDLSDSLVTADPMARADQPGAVHALRIVVRRLRSVLGAFPSVLDHEVTDDLRKRLRRFGAVLGAARDAEVRHARAVALLRADSAEDAGVPSSPLWHRLVDDAHAEYAALHRDLVDYLDSDEYFTLLGHLDALITDPPPARAAGRDAGKELRRALRHQVTRAQEALVRADPDDLAALHDARKASRRLRYAAEALSKGRGAIFGKKVRHLAEAAESVQEAIGDNRDAILFIDRLDRAEAEAAESGEDTRDYGALVERERGNARDAFERIDEAGSRLRALPAT